MQVRRPERCSQQTTSCATCILTATSVCCSEVTGVSPAAGSVMGGTLLTIRGRHFDQTDRPARVLVGGKESFLTDVSRSMEIRTGMRWVKFNDI